MVNELAAAITRPHLEPHSPYESIGVPAMQYVCVHGNGEHWESCDDHNLKVDMLLLRPCVMPCDGVILYSACVISVGCKLPADVWSWRSGDGPDCGRRGDCRPQLCLCTRTGTIRSWMSRMAVESTSLTTSQILSLRDMGSRHASTPVAPRHNVQLNGGVASLVIVHSDPPALLRLRP